MFGIYYILELSLLTLLSVRIILLKFQKNLISATNHFELFFFVCTINQIWGNIDYKNVYFYYFFHCTMPLVLSLSILSDKINYRYMFLLLLLVLLSLYCQNVKFNIAIYLLSILLVMHRLIFCALNSKKNRDKVPLYIAVWCVLFLSNLIFLMNHTKVDWHESKFVDYFLYVTQFVYLSTIILGHVYLRRFIVN